MDCTVRDWFGSAAPPLWCATTAAAAGIGLLTAPTLAAGQPLIASAPAFADLLVTGCAAALARGRRPGCG